MRIPSHHPKSREENNGYAHFLFAKKKKKGELYNFVAPPFFRGKVWKEKKHFLKTVEKEEHKTTQFRDFASK